MTVDELIIELQKQQNLGYGNLKVKYDFGACEVIKAEIEESCDKEKYIHLDWCL